MVDRYSIHTLAIRIASTFGLHKFTISAIGLHESMHKIITDVVPNPICAQLHGVTMFSFGKVSVGVASHIPATPYVSTNQANPQILGTLTFRASLLSDQFRSLNISTDWT